MDIVVTGGAGYVGSLLVPELLKNGHKVRVIDWFLFEPNIFADLGDENLVCMKADIRDTEKVKRILEGADLVIHLASISNDPSSELNHDATKTINLEASCHLGDLAEKAGVSRFINASSASVYGIQQGEPASERSVTNPITVYSICKLESEKYLLGLNKPSFQVTSLRPATLSGFAPRLRLDLTVNILSYFAVCQGFIKVFGGEQYRPNLSVRDMVRAYLAVIESDSAVTAGQVFNVCQDNYKVIDIATQIKDTLQMPELDLVVTPTDDKRSYSLDARKFSEVTGFEPEFDVKDSVHDISKALKDGRVPSPGDAKYRNVALLKDYDFSQFLA